MGFNTKQREFKEKVVDAINSSGLPLGAVRDAMQLIMVELDKAINQEIIAEQAEENAKQNAEQAEEKKD